MNKNLDMNALNDNELEKVSGGRTIRPASQIPYYLPEQEHHEVTDKQVDESFREISERNGLTGMLYYTIKWIKQGFSFDGLDIENEKW